jgi:ParB-like chromosome segregation protein Spo0J
MPSETMAGIIPLNQVVFHPNNLRRNLGDLRPLVESIRRYGLIEPIVVERYEGLFRLRAGHRRTAAATMAKLIRVPAIIYPMPLDDDEWLIWSIQENVQRKAMTGAERVDAVRALMARGYDLGAVSDVFGVDDSTIRSWLKANYHPTGDSAQARRNHRRLGAPTMRRLVRDWREREVDAEQICKELEALFAPKDLGP